ncbi:MAG: hypothetical protein JWP85_2819 [Rhodoglobus sp.]|nr:hypothetical protein [Rhodoglobus sp.]
MSCLINPTPESAILDRICDKVEVLLHDSKVSEAYAMLEPYKELPMVNDIDVRRVSLTFRCFFALNDPYGFYYMAKAVNKGSKSVYFPVAAIYTALALLPLNPKN